MIRELINFTNDLVAQLPDVMQWNNKPSIGLHIFVELDVNGEWKNREIQQEIDYDYYDGKTDETQFLKKAKLYGEYSKTVGASTDANKLLDMGAGGKKIHSCSPFAVSFKIKELDKIEARLNSYFAAAFLICLGNGESDEIHKQRAIAFKQACRELLKIIPDIRITQSNEKNFITISDLKDDNYITIYYTDIPIEDYKNAHDNYLKEKLFNDNNYNSESKITENTFGLSGYRNGLNSKKIFLAHKTASMYKGISGRLLPSDVRALNTFDVLRARKILPNPLPVFIDKEEFKNQSDVIKIFHENQNDKEKMSYSTIIKKIFDKDPNTVLKNYYLFNYRGEEINDFDFVSLFRYKLENCKIENLLQIKDKMDIELHSVFGFESIVIRQIFNNSLVRVDTKKNTQTVKYFDEIDPQYVSGKEPIYHLIMKYRKAIYDYIYKAKLNAITSEMFDDMMVQSIMSDIKEDEYDKFHSKDTSIKEKLNIWFSLYNFFALNENQKRDNMSENLRKHQEMMQELIEGKRELQTNEEFAFVAGQVIHYLLSKSETADKSYSRLEPFLQKSDCDEFKKAIVRIFDMYKHKEFTAKFGKSMAQVMAFNTDTNLKELTPITLAGFFSDNLLYSDKNKQTENQQN